AQRRVVERPEDVSVGAADVVESGCGQGLVQLPDELLVAEGEQDAEVECLRFGGHATMIDKPACLVWGGGNFMSIMSIIRQAEAPRFELPGIEFTGMAAPSRGSAGLCTWRLAVAAGLVSPEPH